MRMKHRSLLGITALEVITFGLYSIYGFFITKTEMNTLNGQSDRVPFFLWFFIPVINIWWFYRFCKAMHITTKRQLGVWVAFFAPIVLYFVGLFIINFNSQFFLNSITQTNFFFAVFSVFLTAAASALPILYYQHYLNKVAR